MNKKTLTLLLLASITLLSVAGVKVSKLTRTTSFASNDLFIVVTGSTTKVTRHIRASDLAVGLGPWITNSGGGASSVTNAVSIVRSNGTSISTSATSLDFIEGTNVTLRATNAAGVVTVQINASGGSGSVDPTNSVLSNIIGTGAVTNKFDSWSFWISPTVTNSYFAENRGLGIITNSTDFGALMQSVLNRGQDGFSFRLRASPYYSAHFVVSNSVTFTNWGIIEAEGNPVTTIHAASGMTTPVFIIGTTANFISGISRFNRIRFEGEGSGAGSVAIKVVNTAEPVFEFIECTGFQRAGIELASTNFMHWAVADHCWFVTKNAGAKGILISGAPISTSRYLNHFEVNDSQFGCVGGGEAISVDVDFPNFKVIDSVFKYTTGTMIYGINHLNGSDAVYSGNKFINFSAGTPIAFAASGGLYTGVTNLNPSFFNNHSDGTAEIIMLGQFVTNVTMSGNSIRGSGPTVLYEDVASNGRINNLDPTELRLGSLSTNALLMTDAYGLVRTTALSGLTLSGGTLTASAGGALTTNANQFGASTVLTISSGALVTNLQARGIDPIGLTASRALSLNASGDITNGTTTAAELEFVNGVTSAIQTQLNGKQNGQTNSSQFGASTVLTIADRASLTNINVYGTGAVFFGHVTGASNITASSFIGSGTGVPILKLQTMMSADNAFAITVPTNRFATTTNTFDFTNVVANDVIKMHSSSAGIVVWTNMPASRVTPVVVTGVGGANTNFTLLSYQQETSINGFTNVSIRAAMGYDAAAVDYWTCIITNGSGSARTLEFSAATNNWRFNGVYGTNAPNTLTNATRLEISGRQHGTNVQVVYGYTPWP